ncbi:hypothetical protein [Sphingobacterium sp.]|uniref:hypothetical protein n=1 Tax=Sphingobacterium sp. TaxID=341027 RepID=UPI0031D5DD43
MVKTVESKFIDHIIGLSNDLDSPFLFAENTLKYSGVIWTYNSTVQDDETGCIR